MTHHLAAPARRLAVIPLLLAAGCVSNGQFKNEVDSLRRELRETQAQLDAAGRRNAQLESFLSELSGLPEEVRANQAAQANLLARLDDVEQARLSELSQQLSSQGGRLDSLAADLDRLSKLPPMELLTELEQAVSDLVGQVEVNQRLTNSNRDNLMTVTHALDRHEVEFNRQMKQLAQYVREQFIPLARGLVTHLYEESRRMTAGAQELEDFARRVDPYKFTHLQPGFTDEAEQPKTSKPEDKGSDGDD